MKKEHLEEKVKQVFEEGRKFTIQNAHFKMTEDSVETFTEDGATFLNKLFKEELEKQSRLMENWDQLKSNWSYETPLTFLSKDRSLMIEEEIPGKFKLRPNNPDTYTFYNIFQEDIVRNNYFDIMEIVEENLK